MVKWKGYGDEHNSWEPKSNLSLEIIKEYEKEKKKKIPKKEPEQGDAYFTKSLVLFEKLEKAGI